LFVAGSVALPLPCSAWDFSGGATNLQHYGSWTSVDIKNPRFGYFVASRASTTDASSGITFNINFIRDQANRCRYSVDINRLLSKKLTENLDASGLVELNIEGGERMALPATLQAQAGDDYAFFALIVPPETSSFLGKAAITVTLPSLPPVRFLLTGVSLAIAAAQDSCVNFELPPKDTSNLGPPTALAAAGSYISYRISLQEYRRSACGKDAVFSATQADIDLARRYAFAYLTDAERRDFEKMEAQGVLEDVRKDERNHFNSPNLANNCAEALLTLGSAVRADREMWEDRPKR